MHLFLTGSGSLAAMAVFEDKFRPDMEVCKPLQFPSFSCFPSCVSDIYRLISPPELAQHCHYLNVLTQIVIEETCYLGKHPLWWPCGPVVLSLGVGEPVLFGFSLLWALSDSLQCRIFSCVLRFLRRDTRTTCLSVLTKSRAAMCFSCHTDLP